MIRHASSRLRAAAAASLVTLAAALLPATAMANPVLTAFNVTKTADTADGSCSTQDCSLREAVIAANASADANIINVPAGRYVLSLSGIDEDMSATGDLDIRTPVVLNGAGARKTIIDAAGIDRVLNVPDTAVSPYDVTIQGVTLTGGSSPNAPGGGLSYQEDSGTLYLIKSTVRGNFANQGGGIENGYPAESTMVIDRSTISGNKAGPENQGGGIQNVGSLTIVNSTISGNTAYHGGGIMHFQGTIDIQYSTIAFNVGHNGGGGISLNSGAVTAEGTIIANNKADFASAKNCDRAVTSNGHNLENGDTCGMDESSDLHGKAHLDPLGYYGGPTKTHKLLATSPAINAGGATFPATDQRGVSRPRNVVADIGSYER